MNNIAAKTPINGTAAIVTSKQSPDSVFNEKYDELATFKNPKITCSPPHSYDLTGERRGRFTVIGAIKSESKERKLKWLLKCDCGMYAARTKSWWGRASVEDLMCDRCHGIAKLRVNEFARRRGRYPTLEECIKLRIY